MGVADELLETQKAQDLTVAEIEACLVETEALKAKLDSSQKILHYLRYKQNSHPVYANSSSLTNWKDRFESINRNNSVLSKKLQHETSLMLHLKEKECLLKHICCGLSMRNDIMGDQLNNLYRTSESMSVKTSLETLLWDILSCLKMMIQETNTRQEDNLLTWNLLTSINFNTLSNTIDHTLEQKSVMSQITSIKINAKDRFQQLNRRIVYLKNELENYEKAIKYTKNRTQGLKNLYARAKSDYKKMFAIQNTTKEEEMVCKNCKTMFTEAENFSWSCKTHPSGWSGNIYWCCGSSIIGQPGCLQSKHIRTEVEKETRADNNNFCSSCRSSGTSPSSSL